MNNKIKIKIFGKILEAELNQTNTAAKIMGVLPLKANINRWGNEIYFEIPIDEELEDGIEILDEGSLVFWPPGNALCIFFGPTPASTDSRPRAASPVTLIGKLVSPLDFDILKNTSDGQIIELSE
jgi:uncharacterized protein